MKNVMKVGFLILTLISLMSCSSDNTPVDYTGDNILYLEASGSPVITLGDKGKVTITIKATQKAIKDTEFTVDILPKSKDAKAEWLRIEEQKILMPKGEREVVFHLLANDNIKPNNDLTKYEITLTNLPSDKMSVKAPIEISLLNVKVPTLTPSQESLIAGYQKKGIDIKPFLGKIKVKTIVNIPADGSIEGFDKATSKTYEGFTIITLSQKATAEQPVLEMVYNPMGLTDFFYYAMRKETIENHLIWDDENAGPLYKKVRALINWNEKSEEVFTAALDGIKIEAPQNGTANIDYIGKSKDGYDDEINTVPFSFTYTAWDRLKVLIDKGNEDAIECHEGGATSNPYNYLNNTDITENAYDDAELKPIVGKIDFASKKMQFSFRTSIQDGGNYIIVQTEYNADQN